MFTWLNKQGVQSDEGFVVQSMHRHYYHYVENDHVMKVVVEPCRHPDTQAYFEEVVLSSFEKWESPHAKEVITDVRREQIKTNFLKALGFMEIAYRLV